jgi:hypothetical protein
VRAFVFSVDAMSGFGSPKSGAILSLLLLIVVSPRAIHGQTTQVLGTKDVVVLFEETLRPGAEEVAEIYPALRDELEEVLEWRLDFRPTVLLVKEEETFQRIAGNRLVVAFAVPEKDLMVVDYSKMTMDPFSIEVTLKHELCHLLLYHYVGGRDLPKWLDEGIAQWVSGGIAEIMMDKRRSVLKGAVLSRRTIGIRALAERFPGEKYSLSLAYEESKSLVDYIIRQFGMEGVLSMLDHLRDGNNPDEAVGKGLFISLDELEERWLHDLKKSTVWFAYVINYLYEILFFMAALILIYGFIRVFMKKRAYMHEEDEHPDL